MSTITEPQRNDWVKVEAAGNPAFGMVGQVLAVDDEGALINIAGRSCYAGAEELRILGIDEAFFLGRETLLREIEHGNAVANRTLTVYREVTGRPVGSLHEVTEAEKALACRIVKLERDLEASK